MNIQQLEYILAVDTYRHFAKAAEHCRVTQPTLSMMIQKLEDELGIKLFDRNLQPVRPTPAWLSSLQTERFEQKTQRLSGFSYQRYRERGGTVIERYVPLSGATDYRPLFATSLFPAIIGKAYGS